MKKLFVVDTNVFLYDPDCMLKLGGGNDILIPIGVVEELDKFKKSRDELGYAARKTINMIDDIIESRNADETPADGIELDGGGKLYIRLDSKESLFSDHVDKNYVDNKILQICVVENENKEVYEMTGQEEKRRLILLTKDTALRIKAETVGVQAEDYKNSLVEDISMYDEAKAIVVEDQQLAELYENGLDDDLNFGTNEYGFLFGTERGVPTPVRGLSNGSVTKVSKRGAYGIFPKNNEQVFLMDALLDPNIKCVAVSGRAGTGKTLLSLAAGLELVVNQVNSKLYDGLIIMRPTISVGKELGFLPGSEAEKLRPWMAPIQDCFEFLHNDTASKTIMEDLQFQGLLEIQAISYIRGRSMPKKFIIIDECQNLSRLEIKTIVTRVGEGTKIILTGDPYQIDNPYLDQHSNGLTHLIDSLAGEDIFAHVTLIQGERSALAKLAAEKL